MLSQTVLNGISIGLTAVFFLSAFFIIKWALNKEAEKSKLEPFKNWYLIKMSVLFFFVNTGFGYLADKYTPMQVSLLNIVLLQAIMIIISIFTVSLVLYIVLKLSRNEEITNPLWLGVKISFLYTLIAGALLFVTNFVVSYGTATGGF